MHPQPVRLDAALCSLLSAGTVMQSAASPAPLAPVSPQGIKTCKCFRAQASAAFKLTRSR